MRIFSRVLLLIFILLGLILAVVLYFVVNPKLPDYVPVEQVHYQDQWSAADRQTYYFTPQGTQVKGLRYDWFTALELPFSEQRFATPEYLARFGFLVDPKQVPTAQNPGTTHGNSSALPAPSWATTTTTGTPRNCAKTSRSP